MIITKYQPRYNTLAKLGTFNSPTSPRRAARAVYQGNHQATRNAMTRMDILNALAADAYNGSDTAGLHAVVKQLADELALLVEHTDTLPSPAEVAQGLRVQAVEIDALEVRLASTKRKLETQKTEYQSRLTVQRTRFEDKIVANAADAAKALAKANAKTKIAKHKGQPVVMADPSAAAVAATAAADAAAAAAAAAAVAVADATANANKNNMAFTALWLGKIKKR